MSAVPRGRARTSIIQCCYRRFQKCIELAHQKLIDLVTDNLIGVSFPFGNDQMLELH